MTAETWPLLGALIAVLGMAGALVGVTWRALRPVAPAPAVADADAFQRRLIDRVMQLEARGDAQGARLDTAEHERGRLQERVEHLEAQVERLQTDLLTERAAHRALRAAVGQQPPSIAERIFALAAELLYTLPAPPLRPALPWPADGKLSKEQRAALEAALAGCCPTEGDLARLVQTALSIGLDLITRGTLQDRITGLLDWTESRNTTAALVAAARAATPNNPALIAFLTTLTMPAAKETP